jgi:prevent-host-death family protein
MGQGKRVAVAEARASFKDLVEDVKDKSERISLTRYNRTVAGIVPAEDLELLEACREELEECQRAREREEREQARPATRAKGRPAARRRARG